MTRSTAASPGLVQTIAPVGFNASAFSRERFPNLCTEAGAGETRHHRRTHKSRTKESYCCTHLYLIRQACLHQGGEAAASRARWRIYR